MRWSDDIWSTSAPRSARRSLPGADHGSRAQIDPGDCAELTAFARHYREGQNVSPCRPAGGLEDRHRDEGAWPRSRQTRSRHTEPPRLGTSSHGAAFAPGREKPWREESKRKVSIRRGRAAGTNARATNSSGSCARRRAESCRIERAARTWRLPLFQTSLRRAGNQKEAVGESIAQRGPEEVMMQVEQWLMVRRDWVAPRQGAAGHRSVHAQGWFRL